MIVYCKESFHSIVRKHHLTKSFDKSCIMGEDQIIALLLLNSIIIMAPVDINTLFEYVRYNYADDLEESLNNSSVNPNETNDEGYNLIHLACKLGRFECLKVLLNDARVNVNIRGPDRIIPLVLSIQFNHHQCIQALLEHKKINANICNTQLRTPLHIAVLTGDVECVKLLLQYPNITRSSRDNNGKTASDLARELKSAHKEEILELFGIDDIKDVHKVPSIETNSIKQDTKKTLPNVIPQIKDGQKSEQPKEDVNKRDSNGETALHRAAKNGDVEQLKKLLNIKGIDVNIQSTSSDNFKGATALLFAARNNKVDCVKLLLSVKDIDVNKKKEDGLSPIHEAVWHGNPECVKLLLTAPGININLRNSWNMTPLAWAEESFRNSEHRQEIIDILKKHGATK